MVAKPWKGLERMWRRVKGIVSSGGLGIYRQGREAYYEGTQRLLSV